MTFLNRSTCQFILWGEGKKREQGKKARAWAAGGRKPQGWTRRFPESGRDNGCSCSLQQLIPVVHRVLQLWHALPVQAHLQQKKNKMADLIFSSEQDKKKWHRQCKTLSIQYVYLSCLRSFTIIPQMRKNTIYNV